MTNDVVAHYLDGSLIKGISLNVDPTRPSCHVQTRGQGMVEVRLADLKALFYVRSFEGDPARKDANHLEPDDTRRIGAHVVEVEFRDGERIVAITPHFPPTRDLFFALPVDRNGNNERVLVNRAACTDVRKLPPGTPAG